jgi:hypothetical protein
MNSGVNRWTQRYTVLDVTVGRAVAQVPADRDGDDLPRYRKPANTEEERRNVTTPVSGRSDRPTQHCQGTRVVRGHRETADPGHDLHGERNQRALPTA